MAEPPPSRKRTTRRADPAASKVVAPGPSGEVRELQSLLQAAGFDPGAADGMPGPATTGALRRFQAANGLPADGIAEPQTLAVLRRVAGGRPTGPDAPADKEATGATPAEPEPRPKSYLPRFSAESMEGQDLLERRGRIEFLASVLAATQLETPLAVGLFGDWGSGKSFFMRRLQERIVAITEASAARGKDEPSLYCSHVRHVTFNAWLHSGSDLWTAFAAQVFRGVAGLEEDAPAGETQALDLKQYQDRLREEIHAATEQEAREERIRTLEGQVAEKRSQLAGLSPDTGGPAGRLTGTLRELVVRLLGLRHGWRDLRAADVLFVVAIALAVAALAVFHTPLTWVAAAAAAALAVVRYLDEARRLRTELKGLESQLREEQTARDEPSSAGELRRDLPLLPEFAQQEAAEWARRAQLDVVTEIRMKFERLSKLIGEGIAARARSDAPPADAFPVERVIVYVDDLDRCQHDVVVGVLETLKLLLSLPHFVVVVGVDSRWLFRSLQVHFRELLQGDGSTADAAWAATPQNYLEKIFQYSIVLQPISSEGFGSLIDHLLGPPAEQMTAGDTPDSAERAPAAAGTAAAPAAAVAEPLDLAPAELVITPQEVAFIRGLAPMFETPRAAKRLANVYRLLRVSVGADRLMQAEGYEPVLVLLSIGIGFPGLAGEAFAEIGGSPEATWPKFVDHVADPSRRSESQLHAWKKLALALWRASPDDVADRRLDSFAEWIPVVAEFSFHPWQELLPPSTQS